MPYKVVKSGKGWQVKDSAGHAFSKRPIPKARALRQLGHIKAATKK